MNTSLIRLLVAFAWLAAFGQHAFAAVNFTVTPTAVSNTYTGTISLAITGLTNKTVVIQKFLDLNNNGVIDGGDILVQQFTLQDGTNFVIGVVTNFNVPGDLNATTGAITATLNFQNGDFMQNVVGNYLYELSQPKGGFTPLTNTFSVTNFPYAQKFTGDVVSNGTSTTVSNAIVMLFPPGGNGGPAGGTVANNSGTYTIQAPVGTYALVSFKSNYVCNFGAPPVVTLGSGATVTTNLVLTNATNSISGKVVDASDPSIGLPGILLHPQSTDGLIAIGFTDTNGNFNVPVTDGNWGIEADDTPLIVHGYLGLQSHNGTNVTAGATGVTLAIPKATALIYGSVKDNLGNPLVGLDVGANDNNNLYETDGYTDANGNYVLGVLGLGTDDSWWVQANGNNQLTNYVFSQETIDGNITNGTAVLQNFTALLATNHITGNVQDSSGNPIVGVGVNANATINSANFSQYMDTDANGNYSMNVANGSWNISINCNGGDDSLDNILGSGAYQCPDNQTAVINNNNATNNFTVQPCGGVQILTTNLPDGQVGSYYDQFLQGSTCSGTLNWSLNDPQDFPSSLTVDSDGEIYGTPDTGGTYNFSVHVDDGNGHSANQNLSLYIASASSPLQVTNMSPLPAAFTNQSYAFTFSAIGGVPPYTWEAISGTLPLTYSLNTDGTLTGSQTTSPPGDYAFRVRVQDASTNAIEKDFILPVAGASLHYTRFGDESAFVAASPQLVTLDFEEYAGAAGSVRFWGNEYESLGIKIVSTNGAVWVEQPTWFWSSCMLSPGWLPYGGGGGEANQSDADSLTLIFDPPTQAVGWRFVDLGGGSGEGIYIYDTNSVLLFAQDGLPGYGIGSGNNPYWGIVFDDKIIARVEIVEQANDGDDVAYDNIRFSGTVALRIANPGLQNGLFHMRLGGPSGSNVVVEASADFQAWTPFQTNALPPPGVLDVSVPLGTNQNLFFRTRYQ